MLEPPKPRVAIVDYGVGNLFSVRQACAAVGLATEITGDRACVSGADAVIVPGVGAFGDAMAALRRLGLVDALREIAVSGRPLLGVCLGLQLFMSESEEFGRHEGLGLFAGSVVRFRSPRGADGRELKVPHVGWNRIFPVEATNGKELASKRWRDGPLQTLPSGAFMYFVHSYYVRPEDPSVVVASARYGDVAFCAAVKRENIFACQFHPERSGALGLEIYRSFARQVNETVSSRA